MILNKGAILFLTTYTIKLVNAAKYNYEPSQFVKFGQLLGQSTFSPSISLSLPPPTGVLVVGIIFAIGLLSCICLNVTFLFKCCCRIIPSRNKYIANDSHAAIKMRIKGNVVAFVLFLFCLLLVSVDQLIIISDQVQLNQGIGQINTAVNNIGNVVTSLKDNGNKLVTIGNDLSLQLTTTTCLSAQAQIGTYISSYVSSAKSFQSATSSLNMISSISGYISLYGIQYRTVILLAIYIIPILTALFFVLFQALEKKIGMRFAIIWGQLSFLLLLVLSAIFLVLTLVSALFCMNPMGNIMSVVPAGVASNVTSYYTSCTGNNQLFVYTSKATNYAQSINSTLYSLQQVCPTDTPLKNMQQDSITVFNTIKAVENSLACDYLQTQIHDLVEVGYCTNTYNGIGLIWISLITSDFLLFIIMIIASYSYQYYNLRFNKIFVKEKDLESNMNSTNSPTKSNKGGFDPNPSPIKQDNINIINENNEVKEVDIIQDNNIVEVINTADITSNNTIESPTKQNSNSNRITYKRTIVIDESDQNSPRTPKVSQYFV
jgi:hypothetical protein